MSGRSARSATRLGLLFLAVGGLAEAAGAQLQEPRLRMSVDATQVTVGGRLHLTVAVEHDPEALVQWPDSLDLTPFEVLEAGSAPPTREGDRAVSAAVFALTAFELGELDLPSFELTVAAADGTEAVLATDPFRIEVVSIGLDEGSDIRDVKGPLSIPVNLLLLWPWLFALFVAASAGYWMARRRRRAAAEDAPPASEAPPRPPMRSRTRRSIGSRRRRYSSKAGSRSTTSRCRTSSGATWRADTRSTHSR